MRSHITTVFLLGCIGCRQAGKITGAQVSSGGSRGRSGLGLWAWPMPMDYDRDGDLDLVVACGQAFQWSLLFENPD